MKIQNNFNPAIKLDKEKISAEILPKKEKISDKIEISNTSKAFDKLNDFLNLGKPGRMDISDLSSEERKEFLKMLSELLKSGIIGYEIKEVDGKPEKHFIVNQIGDKRLYGAKLYTKKDNYYNR
ncbi:MAG: hypothetical protein KJ571_10850 [Bacteroidetes bacterium]|nr:hypothetical protein [Bacteroidota bacterium]